MGDAPIDLENALDEFDNNRDLILELVTDLITQAKDQINIIREGIQNKSCDIVWREAHTIKGGASNIRANVIADIAFKIEQAGKAGDLSKCNDLLTQLENEVKNLEEFMSTI